METQDTERATRRSPNDMAPDVDPGSEPPKDDRNDEIDESPAPDPEEGGPIAEDDPEAD